MRVTPSSSTPALSTTGYLHDAIDACTADGHQVSQVTIATSPAIFEVVSPYGTFSFDLLSILGHPGRRLLQRRSPAFVVGQRRVHASSHLIPASAAPPPDTGPRARWGWTRIATASAPRHHRGGLPGSVSLDRFQSGCVTGRVNHPPTVPRAPGSAKDHDRPSPPCPSSSSFRCEW